MTPKEKADELVDKFTNCNISTVPVMKSEAAKMALICVDEILKDHPYISAFRLRYWQEVKQEIEKL